MNINKIIKEETNKMLREASEEKSSKKSDSSLTKAIKSVLKSIDKAEKSISKSNDSDSEKDDTKKSSSKKGKRTPGKGREFKYGVENVGKANKARNKFELTTINAKKKGEIAQRDDERSLVKAITQKGVNTTEVCRVAGFPNPNNKASAINKVADGDKWGGGAEGGEKPKGKTAHLRQKDISALTQAAQQLGIKV